MFADTDFDTIGIDPHCRVRVKHTRLDTMAEAMRDIFAATGGVTEADLIGAGFSPAEIIEYHQAAARRARLQFVRDVA